MKIVSVFFLSLGAIAGTSLQMYILLVPKDDLKAVVAFLRADEHISCIGLWGRSMGAVTSDQLGLKYKDWLDGDIYRWSITTYRKNGCVLYRNTCCPLHFYVLINDVVVGAGAKLIATAIGVVTIAATGVTTKICVDPSAVGTTTIS
eukprot:Gb_02149 [translate_table: standard]